MVILGVDPGVARTGWGVIEKRGNILKLLAYDCIETSPKTQPERRLADISKHLQSVIARYSPDQAAVEKLFFNTNVKTALSVGEARGVVILTLAQGSIPLFHYTPLQVKIATTGYGRAEKHQVQHMVKSILSLKVIPEPDDAADAIAIALTHAFTRQTPRGITKKR